MLLVIIGFVLFCGGVYLTLAGMSERDNYVVIISMILFIVGGMLMMSAMQDMKKEREKAPASYQGGRG